MNYIFILALLLIILISVYYVYNDSQMFSLDLQNMNNFLSIKENLIPNNSTGDSQQAIPTQIQQDINKCRQITSCDQLKEEEYKNCGYCLADDLDGGNNPFHHGDENGPTIAREEDSKCGTLGDEPMPDWVPPGGVDSERAYKKCVMSRERYVCSQGNKDGQGNQEDAYCNKPRVMDRYFQKRDDNGNIIPGSGVDPKDICGYCSYDKKLYVRQDPEMITNSAGQQEFPFWTNSYKHYFKKSVPTCTNIDIFGDGMETQCKNAININGSDEEKRNACLGLRGKDSNGNFYNQPACMYSYKLEDSETDISIPIYSDVKYKTDDDGKTLDFCGERDDNGNPIEGKESIWGLINPYEGRIRKLSGNGYNNDFKNCKWFEEKNPCEVKDASGNLTDNCLQQIWSGLGFTTNVSKLNESNDESTKKLISTWKGLKDPELVAEKMSAIYNYIYSSDYNTAKHWLNLCFNIEPNVCNRSGLINDLYTNSLSVNEEKLRITGGSSELKWKETPDECLYKLYSFAGGQENGLANPRLQKNNNSTIKTGPIGSENVLESFTNVCNTDDLEKYVKNKDVKYINNDMSIHGSAYNSKNTSLKCLKGMEQRKALKVYRDLVNNANMNNDEAKKVTNLSDGYDKDTKFSNVEWLNKYKGSKLMYGTTPEIPRDYGEKPCWARFAKMMLIHKNVQLLNLNTLSFAGADEFKELSFFVNKNYYPENTSSENIKKIKKNYVKSGYALFTGDNYYIEKDTYMQDTFPYWKFIELSRAYWNKRWPEFKEKILDVVGSKLTTIQNLTGRAHSGPSEAISFTKESIFYEGTLPATTNINRAKKKTGGKFYLYERNNMRYLFHASYDDPTFPYYTFLKYILSKQ